MKTTAIIVTYADRFKYVKQVVDRLLSFNIFGIVIVNNKSVPDSAAALESLASSSSIITLINLDANTGSAYAINRGIEYVLDDPASEFIWLLDDDNLPDKSALKALHDVYQKSVMGRQNLLLASLRTIKSNYVKAVENGTPEITLGRKNGFRSFHIGHLLSKKNDGVYSGIRKFGEVFSVPYGGMFFHKELIISRGVFSESYYLYVDDTEFCLKHRSAGGVIICVLESRIDDLEVSCYNTSRTIINFATKGIYFQMYYYVRNRVYFEKKYLITSWPVYIINMLIYSSLITVMALVNFRFKNIKIYYTAICHGLMGRMGYNEKYRI